MDHPEPEHNLEDAEPTLPASAWDDFETTLRKREPGESNAPESWALVVYAGKALGRIFPLHPGENPIGRSSTIQIPLMDDEVSRSHAAVRLAQAGPSTSLLIEDLGSKNGTFVNGEAVTAPRTLEAGDRISVGSHVLKLVAMDALERAFHLTLMEQSTRDLLTGLDNRASILSELQQRFELSRRHDRPFSVAMVDLDHFKRINDRHGHATGDQALAVFAEVVRFTLRSTDLAGRVGGEEFLFLLPETDLEGAKLVAERLRTFLAEASVPLPEGLLQFTASFGVAQRSPRDQDGGSLMGRADAALYRAKRQGRDRVEADADPL